MPQPHEGHRKRMRERYMKSGFDSFQPHEVLEMLLYYTNPRCDTNELAHEILNQFGSFRAVMQASPTELMTVKGVGEQAASLISMILPVHRKYVQDIENSRIFSENTDEVGEFLKVFYADKYRELASALLFDTAGRLITIVEIGSEGTSNKCTVDVNKLVKAALVNDAIGIIIAHNHPGGTALPSSDDVMMTMTIRDAISPLNLFLLDHIIVAGEDFVCMSLSKDFDGIFTNSVRDALLTKKKREK